MRTHLRRLAANTGKVDRRLTIEWPPYGRAVWETFKSLGRAPSMNGLTAISQQEIQAWQQNHGIRLTPWELEMIEVFDRITLEVLNKQDGP